MSDLLVASTEASAYFADCIVEQMGAGRLYTVRKTFGGGEKYMRLAVAGQNDLLGKDVIFVGSTHTDEDLLELYRTGCALAQYGTRRRVFVIPFFGYSTMERAVKPGEVIAAKTNARMLSAIPNSGLGNTFLFMDLHAQGLLHYFEDECLRTELHSESVFVAAIQDLVLDDVVFASADLGRPQWIQSFAEKFRTSMAFVHKERVNGVPQVKAVIGDVKGKNVIIYDDMTRSGSSAANAATAYKDSGAKDVYLVLSHLALNDPSVIDLLLASCFKKIITTNTHPATKWLSHHTLPLYGHPSLSKFDVLDVSPIFTQALKEIFHAG